LKLVEIFRACSTVVGRGRSGPTTTNDTATTTFQR